MKEELIEMNGKVTEVLPEMRFRVDLENGHQLVAYTSGRMKKNHIRIIARKPFIDWTSWMPEIDGST